VNAPELRTDGAASDTHARLRVVELGAAWGVGGTEQAIELRAVLLDRQAFDVQVVTLFGGPRFTRLVERGVSTHRLEGDIGRLEGVLAELEPHVVHYTRPERKCRYSQAVQAACLARGVPVVIETNVFGRPAGWPQARPPDITAHMSFASMLRAARLAHKTMPALFDEGHRAVYLPVPTPQGYGTEPSASREEMRARLGVKPGELLACRVTRADLRKWSPRLEAALPALMARVPELKLALMAPPPQKRRLLERRFGGRVLCLELESDIRRVQALYAASDLMLHSSGIGESFGLSMAEAMAAGLPVVVDSTPSMDNAQVELVEHGRTGFVVKSAAAFVEAVRILATEPERRREMGRAAAARAAERFADHVVVGRWERLYLDACARAGIALSPALAAFQQSLPPPANAEEYRDFSAAYAASCARALGPPPSPVELCRTAVTRARDSVGYARQIGAGAVWRVIRSRLRSGSLGRD